MENTNTGTPRAKGRWGQLIMGMLVMLFAGIIYSWSILKLPFTTEFGWDAAQLGVNYTITILCFCVGGFISGLISNKTKVKSRLITGAILACAGFAITSCIKKSGGLPLLYISYGVLAGLGIGITYNTVISIVMAWFPDKKGVASGALLLTFALTTLMIGNFASRHMGTAEWRDVYRILAVVTGGIIFVASQVLKKPAESAASSVPAQSASASAAAADQRDYTAMEMIKRRSFWLLFLFLVILAAVGNAAISFAKDILVDAGSAQKLAVLIVGLISLLNGFGRLIAGALYDSFIGLKKTLYIMSAISILATGTVVLALHTDSFALCVAGLGLCYLTYGFVPTTATTFSGAFYGNKNLPLNMSIMTLHMIPAAFIATLAGNLKTATGSFQSLFIILAVGTLAALGLNVGIKKP